MNPQNQSPLFARLPSEIRLSIWVYALSAQDNPQKPYPPNRFFYRPGYHFHPLIDTDLLLTCKRVYHEARLFPVALNEHVFWLFRGPTRSIGNGNTTDCNGWFSTLHDEQKDAVQSVHFFVQQYALESIGSWPNLQQWSFRTRQLTLTFRHADWWSWESPPQSSDQLGICPWLPDRVPHAKMVKEPLEPSLDYMASNMQRRQTWGWHVGMVAGLQNLVLEFETVVQKKFQLDTVVDRAKYWKFPLFADNHEGFLHWTGEVKKNYKWEGLVRLREDYLPMNKALSDDEPKRRYIVKVMEWTKRNSL